MRTLQRVEDGQLMVQVLVLMFSMSTEKDVFLRQFEKLTAMRLINETSASKEAEELLMEGLKKHAGVE